MNSALLLVASLLGGTTFWGITRHVDQRMSLARQQLATRYELRPVIVAARNLAAGSVIAADALAVRQMPRAFLASDVLAPERRSALLGGELSHALRSGDPVTLAAVVPQVDLPFSAQVAAGERAVTVPVDEISSVGGLLQPGDRIDLLYSYDRPVDNANPPGPRSAVRLLLADLSVLATGKATRTTQVRTDDGRLHDVDTDYSTVTLRVTPRQAQVVTLAQRAGDVVAVLRNRDDGGSLTLAAMNWPELLADQSSGSRTGVARRRVAPGVELIIGGQGGAITIRHLPLARPLT